jgi:serine/threonine protein phosphatase PrpC
MPVKIQFHAYSERGKRDINEDSYCAERIGRYFVFGVADGLGGHAAGEIASGMAIECLRREMTHEPVLVEPALEDIMMKAHEEILVMAAGKRDRYGMATTLLICITDEDGNCTLQNTGDSRAFIINENFIRHTKDQSLVQELIDVGKISPEEAIHHPLNNIISQAVGDPESELKPDVYTTSLKENILLLSSDGLHDYVRKERIQEIVMNNLDDLRKTCGILVQEALQNGSDDNITVIMVKGGE